MGQIFGIWPKKRVELPASARPRGQIPQKLGSSRKARELEDVTAVMGGGPSGNALSVAAATAGLPAFSAENRPLDGFPGASNPQRGSRGGTGAMAGLRGETDRLTQQRGIFSCLSLWERCPLQGAERARPG